MSTSNSSCGHVVNDLPTVSTKSEESHVKDNVWSTNKRNFEFEKNCEHVISGQAKKPRLLPEECDIVINIDQTGCCTFDIISNVESVVSGIVNGNTERTDEKKAVDNSVKQVDTDNVRSQFPPTSIYVALDCEFVGVGNNQSALGRCSVVDYDGKVLLDIYAKPEEPITDYRTPWSGITRSHMMSAIPQEFALSKIAQVLQDKIVVGHDLANDFRVLGFHPVRENIRDTVKYPFYKNTKPVKHGLKFLAFHLLGVHIQRGSHCSVIDAQTTMNLYRLVRTEWETSLLLAPPRRPGSGPGSDNSRPGTSGVKIKKQKSSSEPKQDQTCGKQAVRFSATSVIQCSTNRSVSLSDKTSQICDKNTTTDITHDLTGEKHAKDSVDVKTDSILDRNILIPNRNMNIWNPEVRPNGNQEYICHSGTSSTDEQVTYRRNCLDGVNGTEIQNGTCSNSSLNCEKVPNGVKILGKSKSDSCLVTLKKKSKKKKKNGMKSHFGQINIGNFSAAKYFEESSNMSFKSCDRADKKPSMIRSDVNNSLVPILKDSQDKFSFESAVKHLYEDEFWPELN